MFLPDHEPVLFPTCNFLLPHLQRKKIANFAPDRAIIVESESFQTFFATFLSHKERT